MLNFYTSLLPLVQALSPYISIRQIEWYADVECRCSASGRFDRIEPCLVHEKQDRIANAQPTQIIIQLQAIFEVYGNVITTQT